MISAAPHVEQLTSGICPRRRSPLGARMRNNDTFCCLKQPRHNIQPRQANTWNSVCLKQQSFYCKYLLNLLHSDKLGSQVWLSYIGVLTMIPSWSYTHTIISILNLMNKSSRDQLYHIGYPCKKQVSRGAINSLPPSSHSNNSE